MKEVLRHLVAPTIMYSQKISENDIMQLQDLFLTTGFHRLKFSDLCTARTHFYSILDSLAFYQSPTGVSLANLSFRADIHSLSPALLAVNSCEEAVGSEFLESYLSEYLNCDFLWLELGDQLTNAQWYSQLLALIDSLQLARQIPICLVEIAY